MMLSPGVKRIIFIRAGRYDYAELELGKSVHLVGDNNVGKTSLIESLQFLYIGNFSDMRFGNYKWEETQRYYFNSDQSYILFECMTGKGKYVTVGLHGRGALQNYAVERFTFSGQYIKDVFVLPDNHVRAFDDVKMKLDEDARHFRLLDPKDIRASVLGTIDDAQISLGIVPLRDDGKYGKFSHLFRNLLRLNNMTQQDIKETLLEVHDQFRKPEINLVAEYGTEFARAKLERDKLNELKRILPEGKRLKEQWEKHTSARKDIPAFYQHLERIKTETIQRLRADEKRFGDAARLAEEGIEHLNRRLKEVRGEITKRADERGGAKANLTRLVEKEKALQGFVLGVEEVSLQNLNSEIAVLQGKLHANTDSVEVIQREIKFYEGKLKDLLRSHDNFALLVGTALKAHFSESEIRDVFRVLNPSLLSTPIQVGSIEVLDEEDALKNLCAIKDAIRDGVFEWGGTKMHLSSLSGSSEILHDLESIKAEIETVKKHIEKRSSELSVAQDAAAVRKQVDTLTEQAEILQGKIFEWNIHQEDFIKKPEWEGIVKTKSSEIEVMEIAVQKIEEEKFALSEQINRNKISANQAGQDVEKVYKERYVPADTSWSIGLFDPSWTEDFHQAASIYREMHAIYISTGEEVAEILESIRHSAPSAGDHFVGTTLEEQIDSVIITLDSIQRIEDSCKEIWEGCVVGLRTSFSYILKDLDALNEKMRVFNQHLVGVSISNLKRITLDIEERKDLTKNYRDMISSEGTLFAGLSESTRAIADISKMIEQNPIIRLADLFGVRFNIEFADGSKKSFSDLSSIESNGTTIMIKALINMILIRDMMRPAVIKSGELSIPFYLDEANQIDPKNLKQIVDTARRLGFCPVLASTIPVAVAENLYFVQWANKGKAVLDSHQRIRREVKEETIEDATA
ncbi:MAG: hypothetical protein PXX73_06600 [Sideroxydans sp.]|nr:hypothetical protein [Sideroxydans sp.]